MAMMSEVGAGNLAQHREAVRRFVRRLVRDEALAEDLTQETFLRVQRTASRHQGAASERSWLCAIALNLVRDHARASARRPPAIGEAEGAGRHLPSAAEDAERAALQSEMSVCVHEFLLRLPRPQYDVVSLHDIAGLTHDEIAAVLGISTGNARVLLHRGRKALRALLARNCLVAFDDPIPCERRPPRRKTSTSGCAS